MDNFPGATSTLLLDKLDDPAERDWYAAAALHHGWSRMALLNQIVGRLYQRVGAAPSNFARHLAELAQELTEDPYVFDFLDPYGASPQEWL